MKKLLITGSSGFVGSYFIEHYKEKYEIESFSFLQDDFDSLSCEGVDAVLHLSALVHQMGGASADEYERVNVTQTLRLAQKAKEAGVGHFLFMSTVKVYGEESDSVYTEQTPPCPLDEYGKSKLKTELELQKLEDEHFRVSIIRTPIVYGRGVKANIQSLVSLVRRVLLLPFGGIANRRSMVYVGNLCHLVDEVIRFRVVLPLWYKPEMTESAEIGITKGELHGLDSVSEHGMTRENIFLAADDTPLSTTRLIELIANAMGKRVYLFRVPFFETLLKLLKPSFHKRLYGSLEVDNSLTKERLNLHNPYSVEEGVALMVDV